MIFWRSKIVARREKILGGEVVGKEGGGIEVLGNRSGNGLLKFRGFAMSRAEEQQDG